MSCLGVFFAIDKETVQDLKKEKRSNLVDFMQENIEEVYFTERKAQLSEVDKAWDAIQRAFGGGELEWKPSGGAYPANIIVLGGEILYGDNDNEDDYIISLKNPAEVADIYKFLSELQEPEFREHYFKIDQDKYWFGGGDDDFEYTWYWLSGTVDFWKNAAEQNLSVIFTVDQ